MPSGKTHDMVTFALAPPTFAAAWGLTGSVALSAAATVAMLFGGLMFGPDLDIQSRQYTRWGPLRFLWWPYKVIFRHRSRWSHGIIFGTLIRVVYFAAVVTLEMLATCDSRMGPLGVCSGRFCRSASSVPTPCRSKTRTSSAWPSG